MQGGKWLTMVVIFVGCLVLGDDPNVVLFLPYKFFVLVQTLVGVKLLTLPGGTVGYPAQPRLIHLSVRPSVRPSVRLYGPAD